MPSLEPMVGESEVGRADTETERGLWVLMASLPNWEVPAGQGRLAEERVSTVAPKALSRRPSKALQPDSSLCSPPAGQETELEVVGA